MSDDAGSDVRPTSPRRRLGWFLLIFVVALGLRLAHVAQLQSSPLIEAPILDEQVHDTWAQQFAAGEAWSVDRRTGEPRPYFRAPLYVWFLGGVYALAGHDPGVAPRVVQAILGALACGLLFLLGARLFDERTGVIAGLAMAATWTLVYFDGELLIVPLLVFLDTLLLLLLARARDLGTRLAWALAGVVLGLSALARPNILLFAPVVAAWILWLERPRGLARGLATAAVFGVAVAACVLPVTLRNTLVAGDSVLISSQGGVNFFIGNNPVSDGTTAIVPGTSADWWEGHDQTHAIVAQATGSEPTDSEVSQWFFARAFEFWRDQPGVAFDLFVHKARLFFSRQEWANNKCIYTFVDEFTPWTARLPIGFWIAGPLGLLGLLIALRRDPSRLFPLWAFVATYSLSVVAFFVTARFRQPVLPALILLGVYAATWLVRRARQRATGPLVTGVLTLAALFALVLHIPGRGYSGVHRVTEDFYGTLANELARQGKHDEALYWFGRTVESARQKLESGEATPEHAAHVTRILYSSLYMAGNLLEQQGRAQESLNVRRQLLPYLAPDSPQRLEAHERMAFLLDQLGRPNKAIEQRAEAARIRDVLSGR